MHSHSWILQAQSQIARLSLFAIEKVLLGFVLWDDLLSRIQYLEELVGFYKTSKIYVKGSVVLHAVSHSGGMQWQVASALGSAGCYTAKLIKTLLR